MIRRRRSQTSARFSSISPTTTGPPSSSQRRSKPRADGTRPAPCGRRCSRWRKPARTWKPPTRRAPGCTAPHRCPADPAPLCARSVYSARTDDLGERLRGVLGLLDRHLGEERHAEHALAGTLGVREAAGRVTEAGVGGLQVDGPRIVNGRAHAARRQRLADPVASVDVDDEERVDAFGVRVVRGEVDARAGEPRAVQTGDLLAARGPRLEAPQLDAQDGALEPLHAVVVADTVMEVAPRLAVVAQRPRQVSDVVAVRGERAALAVGAEVLGGVEAEGGRLAEAAHAPPAVARAVGLAGLLDDGDAVARGDRPDGMEG